MPAITPATSRAIGPTASSDGPSGRTPSTEIRPWVGLSPTVPQQAEGVRIDPAVSVPRAMSASPVATATALQLELPPGMRLASSGFSGVPYQGLMQVPPKPTPARLGLIGKREVRERG